MPGAVTIPGALRLAPQIKRLNRCELHLERRLHRLDSRLESRIVRPHLGVPAIQTPHQRELPLLAGVIDNLSQ